MNRHRELVRSAKYAAYLCVLLALLAKPVCAARGRTERVNLFPRLQVGQTVEYQISYHSDKHVKTESNVIGGAPDDSAKIDLNALLHLEILGVQARGDREFIHPRTKFEVLDPDSHSHFKVPNSEPPEPQAQ